jgi:RNA polymerase sigma-70 factor (ECF subfamily)
VNRKTPFEEHLFRDAVFREMFASNFSRVVRYVEGQTSNRAVAEDIAAEVFRVAWQKLDPEEPFGLPWLIRTAIHKTRDYQRREYRGARVMATLSLLTAVSGTGVSNLDRLALQEAMSKLSEKDLQIVRLTYWDGLTAGEVALVLRMKEGAIWTRLHRARAQLRAALLEPVKAGSHE